MSSGWEDRAADWLAWARTPDHDSPTLVAAAEELSSYAAALERAGLLIEKLREAAGLDDRDRRMPQFLLWRAVKP